MRLTVLTTPELEPAYRLAGSATAACSSPDEAEAALRELLERGPGGLVAVHEPFLDELPAELAHELERSDRALVVGLPTGEREGGDEDRTARLLRMLRQAVGYEMTFERGEEAAR